MTGWHPPIIFILFQVWLHFFLPGDGLWIVSHGHGEGSKHLQDEWKETNQYCQDWSHSQGDFLSNQFGYFL